LCSKNEDDELILCAILCEEDNTTAKVKYVSRRWQY